jgi:hypothetical protein
MVAKLMPMLRAIGLLVASEQSVIVLTDADKVWIKEVLEHG